MTLEETISGAALEDAPLRLPKSAGSAEHAHSNRLDAEEDDGDESDGDFELETMEDNDDDDDDDDDDDEDEGEDDEQEREQKEDDDDLSLLRSVHGDEQSLRDELIALIDAAADDTIAHRTRTKYSLVDVEIDSLESLLPPDPADASGVDGESEYQRFLASLLPVGATEADHLSFLDEEDDEYRPEEEEEDEEEDDDDDENQRRRKESSDQVTHDDDDGDDDDELEQQSVRVSKRELTELLWDSTQLKVPPTFPQPSASQVAASSAMKATTTTASRSQGGGRGETAGAASAASHESNVADLKDAAALKELTGSISQQQCIQLASQIHKHFQLLLQTFHLVANNDGGPKERRSGAETTATKPPVDQTQLAEVEGMLRELQIRGKRALEHKAKLLSKLTLSTSNSGSGASAESLSERRVTRSISAAHAAVAHPSMFDIVGSQSMEELTESFQRGCSMSDRNQNLQKSMLELDKHVLMNRKKRRTKSSGSRSVSVFLPPEDRLLLHGVKRCGIEANAWTEIQETLLPTKEVAVLSKRYRYLVSKRKREGAKEFKDYHVENSTRKKGLWMLEEDVRVARGVVEYFGNHRRFVRIASKYLPHRHRLEIRKRWERLKESYRSEDGTVQEKDESMPVRAAAREFAAAVKRFLEAKLRKQVINLLPLALPPAHSSSGRLSVKPVSRGASRKQSQSAGHNVIETNGCSVKNLHPALFFSSWAVIQPATLLERTCEHNWPAFINEKRKDRTSESTLDLVTRAAASRVEEETASHRADLTSRRKHLEPVEEDGNDDTMDLSLDSIVSGKDDHEEDEEDEEESDFEHEELLSSEAEESDSEYERMELPDDDDDGDELDDTSFDEDGQSHDESASPSDQQNQHSLRLNRLSDSTRARRSLAALERRLTGKNQQAIAGSSTGFTPLRLDTTPFETFSADASFDEDASGLDLLAYEELSESAPSEGGAGFEQDELQSSSDDGGDDRSELEQAQETTNSGESAKRSHDVSSPTGPAKRAKVHMPLARCPDCGGASCICSSSRMQRLLHRIQPPGAGASGT